MRAAVNALEEKAPRAPRVLVFGCLRDKPVAELAQILFPLFDSVVLTTVSSPRAASMNNLRAAAQATGVRVEQAESVAEALERARAAAAPGGRIVVSGSVYLVGETRHLLRAEMP